MTDRIKGNCLCGGVRFETEFKGAAEYGACHCSMCQHWNGGPGLAGEFVNTGFDSDETLRWFRSSDWAERGFCFTCGSNLFYRLVGMPQLLMIQVGCLDLPDGVTLAEHIFIDEKPDHYDFAGSAPRLTGAEFLARLQDTSE